MNEEDAGYRELALQLQYRHPIGGDLDPYWQGLAQDRLMGTRCDGCNSTWCPPRFACQCRHPTPMAWVELKGTGIVEAITECDVNLPFGTDSTDYGFALVKVDGANNLALGRVQNPCKRGDRVRLVPASHIGTVAHPAQWLLWCVE